MVWVRGVSSTLQTSDRELKPLALNLEPCFKSPVNHSNSESFCLYGGDFSARSENKRRLRDRERARQSAERSERNGGKRIKRSREAEQVKDREREREGC